MEAGKMAAERCPQQKNSNVRKKWKTQNIMQNWSRVVGGGRSGEGGERGGERGGELGGIGTAFARESELHTTKEKERPQSLKSAPKDELEASPSAQRQQSCTINWDPTA